MEFLSVCLTLCISCGVAWRGPGRRSGTASGRPVATKLHCTPCQGRDRPDRQLHARVSLQATLRIIAPPTTPTLSIKTNLTSRTVTISTHFHL